MSPHSVASMMILIALVTTAYGINNTRSSSYCDDGRTDDPSCLIGGMSDFDSDEFMMDSEISRRILAGNSGTKNALDPGKASSCDRNSPQCHAGQKNKNPPGVDCAVAKYNRGCYRYP